MSNKNNLMAYGVHSWIDFQMNVSSDERNRIVFYTVTVDYSLSHGLINDVEICWIRFETINIVYLNEYKFHTERGYVKVNLINNDGSIILWYYNIYVSVVFSKEEEYDIITYYQPSYTTRRNVRVYCNKGNVISSYSTVNDLQF